MIRQCGSVVLPLGTFALVRVGERALQCRGGAFLLDPRGADFRCLVHRLGGAACPATGSRRP